MEEENSDVNGTINEEGDGVLMSDNTGQNAVVGQDSIQEQEQKIESNETYDEPPPLITPTPHSLFGFALSRGSNLHKLVCTILILCMLTFTILVFQELDAKVKEESRVQLNVYGFGGIVLSTRGTRTIGSFGIFGVKKIYFGHPPEIIMQFEDHLIPGNCWGFEGQKGNIIMGLKKPTMVIGFYLEHFQEKFNPLGHILSAPRQFRVYGMHEYGFWTQIREMFFGLWVEERMLLGEFSYMENGTQKQYFPINSNTLWAVIELEILNNHGAEFTCIYKFRVMGKKNGRSQYYEISN